MTRNSNQDEEREERLQALIARAKRLQHGGAPAKGKAVKAGKTKKVIARKKR